MTTRTVSDATRAAYQVAWALFRDWCTATDAAALPASPQTVVTFLAEMPAAPATQARRVAAIDRAHRQAGHAAPSASLAVRAALRQLADKPPPEPPVVPAPPACEAIETAYRTLPTHGWPAGLFGRRDRCLLTLTAVASMPIEGMRILPASSFEAYPPDGVLQVHTGGSEVHFEPTEDPTVCPSCACVAWLRALALAADEPSHRVLRDALHRARPLTHHSGHICRSSPARRRPKPPGPLLVSIDRHGYPRIGRPMSARRLDEIVRSLLGGAPRVHPAVPAVPQRLIEEPQAPSPQATPPNSPPPDRARLALRHAAAMERRRRDHNVLADVDKRLDGVDRDAEALERDIARLVELWPDEPRPVDGARIHSFL
jgi:hypothetical protein